MPSYSEKQKLIYIFDYLSERMFFIELSEIITGKSLKEAVCTKKEGKAPKQIMDFDEMVETKTSLDLDETFYGDEAFDLEDFDPEGFDVDINNIADSSSEKDLF